MVTDAAASSSHTGGQTSASSGGTGTGTGGSSGTNGGTSGGTSGSGSDSSNKQVLEFVEGLVEGLVGSLPNISNCIPDFKGSINDAQMACNDLVQGISSFSSSQCLAGVNDLITMLSEVRTLSQPIAPTVR